MDIDNGLEKQFAFPQEIVKPLKTLNTFICAPVQCNSDQIDQ